MNDEQLLLEQLERATASGNRMPAELDAETAELRGEWLAFGDMLEQADAEGARGMPARADVALAEPVRDPGKEGAGSARMWFAGALAVSLVVVIATTVWWQSQITIQPGPGPGVIVKQEPQRVLPVPAPDPLPEPTPEAVVQVPAAETPDEWLWDGELDAEIAAAGQAVLTVEQDWFARSGPARVLTDRLDRMEETWDNDDL